MIFNPVKGVYGVGGYAAITVRFPVGATCTCKYSGKTLTADGSGLYTFFVPFSGAWVIKAASGALSAQTTVNITTMGENKFVELAFTYSAAIDTSFITPYVYAGSASITNGIAKMVSGSATGYATFHTIEKIRLTGYSKIRIHVYQYPSGAGNVRLCISNQPLTNPSAAERSTQINNVGWFELSLSNISGDYYVQFGDWGGNTTASDSFMVDEIQFVA